MITTITEARVRATALVDAYDAAVAVIAPDLEQGTQTRRQVKEYRGVMAGVSLGIRNFRADLDVTESARLLATTQDAARILQVWGWERTTRKAMGDFAVAVGEAAKVARGLNEGADRRTVTVRQGETLQSIAQRELGDYQAWAQLLAANPGLRPGALAVGAVLVVPERR